MVKHGIGSVGRFRVLPWVLLPVALVAACKKSADGPAQSQAPVAVGKPDVKHNLLKNADFEDGGSLPWLTFVLGARQGQRGSEEGRALSRHRRQGQ